MSAVVLPRPGVNWGTYPERQPHADSWLEQLNHFLRSRVSGPQALRQRASLLFAAQVQAATESLTEAWTQDPAACVARVSARLHRTGLRGEALVQGVALVSLVWSRHSGLQPFETQLRGAYLMLRGGLAEMATGEGKTCAVMLAAGTAALAGVPVHVMSSNDYLVERDAKAFAPVARELGFSAGMITGSSKRSERATAYAAAVTYVTARELAFDYLRDRLTSGPRRDGLEERADELGAGAGAAQQRLLRGLCLCIIDEADSILLDEARTPLLISVPKSTATQAAAVRCSRQALTLAGALSAGQHFQIAAATREVSLLPEGLAFLERRSRRMGEPWNQPRRREELVCLALHARHVLQRDRDYIVHGGAVAIVDPNTGRIAEGRRWSRGIHQMLELKEGCKPEPDHETAARISYQRLFARYHHLCGVSGTISESASELAATYGTPATQVPLNRPSQRRDLGLRVFATEEAKWSAIVDRIQQCRADGRPVLVGTGSVAASEALAAHLLTAGIEYQLLNARQDANEARIVALAGRSACVTVATNMAGRGTDIQLQQDVVARGGLHVINAQLAPSRRIDRQLIGRGARQGDPGSCEQIISLQEPLLAQRLTGMWRRLAERCIRTDGVLARRALQALLGSCQRVDEHQSRQARARLARQDEDWQRLAGFGVLSE